MHSATHSHNSTLGEIATRLSHEIANAATPADILQTLREARLRAERSAVGDLNFAVLLIDAMAALNARAPDEDIMLSFKEEWVASFVEVVPPEDEEPEEPEGRLRMVAG